MAHFSGTRFFLNMEFAQEYNKLYMCSFNTYFRRINKINQQIQKTLFLAHFYYLRAKTIFFKNLALPRTAPYGFLTPHQNFEKNDDPIPRKWQDRRTDRGTYERNERTNRKMDRATGLSVQPPELLSMRLRLYFEFLLLHFISQNFCSAIKTMQYIYTLYI